MISKGHESPLNLILKTLHCRMAVTMVGSACKHWQPWLITVSESDPRPGGSQDRVLGLGSMNKSDLAARLAKQTRSSKAEAADQLDRVVHRIVVNLRKGQPAPFPGLGR